MILIYYECVFNYLTHLFSYVTNSSTKYAYCDSIIETFNCAHKTNFYWCQINSSKYKQKILLKNTICFSVKTMLIESLWIHT